MDEHAVASGLRSFTLHDDQTRSMLCALSRSRGPKSLHPTVEGRPMAVGDKVLGAEAHWMMGRVMPRQFLDGIGEYLDLEAPERKDELIMAVRARAEELADADRDLVVDEPSKGALAISAVVLAAFEQLIPLFDGDERRTILFLQHVMGTVLKRPYQLMFQTLSKREEPLDKIDKACRKMEPLYGQGWDMRFGPAES
jgi:hypothetical protein